MFAFDNSPFGFHLKLGGTVSDCALAFCCGVGEVPRALFWAVGLRGWVLGTDELEGCVVAVDYVTSLRDKGEVRVLVGAGPQRTRPVLLTRAIAGV